LSQGDILLELGWKKVKLNGKIALEVQAKEFFLYICQIYLVGFTN
jgi:hypothetical protein